MGKAKQNTYEIFEEIDEMTKNCEFDLANFKTIQGEGLKPSTFYRGSVLNGVMQGIGIFESSNSKEYATMRNNKYDGFSVFFSKNKYDFVYYQGERRADDIDVTTLQGWDSIDHKWLPTYWDFI